MNLSDFQRALAHDYPEDSQSQAAVLIALVPIQSDWHIILIRRSDSQYRHSGEVALPGGLHEPIDDSLYTTALRESQEEVNLAPDIVTYLGQLPVTQTRWGMWVTPFVGAVPTNPSIKVNSAEVGDVFTVPISLLSNRFLLCDEWEYQGNVRRTPRFKHNQYAIWGFTAIVLQNFCRIALQRELDLDNCPVANCFTNDILAYSQWKRSAPNRT